MSGFSRVRLLCALNGHHWADRPFSIVRNTQDEKVLQAIEECERPGCPRIRTTVCNLHLEILWRKYEGEQERIAVGTDRADMRREFYGYQKIQRRRP